MESFEEWQDNINEFSREKENSEASVAESFNRSNSEFTARAISVQEPPFLINLIEEVRKYPCIWNVSSKLHKDKPRKLEALRRISAALCLPENVVCKEFDRLKDNYRRCIKKRELTTRSGSGANSKPLQKTRKRRSDQIDDLLALSLANDIAYAKNGDSKKTTNPEDQDILFCSSLVTTFRNLTGKKNKLAKIKVLQVLAEFEDDDEM
ncbi:uncharacterized protein LOC124457000 [Xenia sp. Carnegie-2017]|uniref:uncharacterized protein LOC124457000 n=1 Tax=Xenia sp. Carnegie-2017 TaxID=2897299 RepID=UPI001F04B033|nr:uncharacterized protein LOC124457000 [Xenia sp. Carnegie-2017]